jgi:hypothetical protein
MKGIYSACQQPTLLEMDGERLSEGEIIERDRETVGWV